LRVELRFVSMNNASCRADVNGDRPAALSPETWPFRLEDLPEQAYLVGGAVRDALLDRKSEYLDLDFVLPENAVETAQDLARRYQAGFVLLDAERQIARVVFANGTADFALQEGETLEADLRRRDFTVNAIAYNPHTRKLIDPLHGGEDLQRGWLRMISSDNLQDDPLRLLRAYRQAAQLGFTLESNTQEVVRQFAPYLSRIAAERVNSELSYLLKIPQGTPWLLAAQTDGLLAGWFPSATTVGTMRVQGIDRAADRLSEIWQAFAGELSRELRSTLRASWVTIAKLTCLVSPDTEIADHELMKLKYSRTEIRGVLTLLNAWHSANSAEAISHLSIANLFFWFKSVGAVFPAFALFALASGVELEAIAPLVDRFVNPDDPVAHPQPLVDGKTLMAALNLSKGPRIGRLLTEIQIARAQGKISTPQAAIEFARTVVIH
jgi:tRNA nucleotidyltransferase (CCA-adding enzyme)